MTITRTTDEPTALAIELATAGLRLAAPDEPGWNYMQYGGVARAWVTDAPPAAPVETIPTNTNTGKAVEYDRLTKDYAARYEGDLIGYFKTYHAAEMVLDAFAYELLSSPLAQEPSQDAIDYADALLAIAPMLADALDYDTLPDDAPGTDDPDEGPQQRRRCATCRVERLYPAEARPYCCYAPMVRA